MDKGVSPRMQIATRSLVRALFVAFAFVVCAPSGGRGDAAGAAYEPLWMPRRPTLVVFSRRQGRGAKHDIYIAAADGSRQRRLTSWRGDEQTPRFSPDGRTIVFRAAPDLGAAPDIWTMRRDGTHKRNLTRTPKRTEWSPTFTPNGRRIVYSCGSAPTDVGNDLCVMNADGTHRRVFLHDPNSSAEYPSFSPTGARFAYIRYDARGVFQVWTATANGRRRRRLTDATWPAWSPDGGRIAFKRPAGTGDIWVMRPDGSAKTNLTRTRDLDEQFPTWLPDGRLGFTRGDGVDESSYGLWVMNRDGSHQKEVIQGVSGWADWTAR